MIKIRRALLSLLGEKKYLSFLSTSFQNIYKAGLAGKNYQDVYFLKNFLLEGDYCLDIGAHLGYYTCELSRLVKAKGKVIAIEPISKFHNTLKSLLIKQNIKNVELLQIALGGDGEFVEMGIPEVNKMKRFAYAKVIDPKSQQDFLETEKVRNENGDQLFVGLPRLDFIKCDVEGLEVPVFSSMLQVLEKHNPILLCELADKNERIKFYKMVNSFGYNCFKLENKKLHLIDVNSDVRPISHNHYFIPKSREERLAGLIAK